MNTKGLVMRYALSFALVALTMLIIQHYDFEDGRGRSAEGFATGALPHSHARTPARTASLPPDVIMSPEVQTRYGGSGLHTGITPPSQNAGKTTGAFDHGMVRAGNSSDTLMAEYHGAAPVRGESPAGTR